MICTNAHSSRLARIAAAAAQALCGLGLSVAALAQTAVEPAPSVGPLPPAVAASSAEPASPGASAPSAGPSLPAASAPSAEPSSPAASAASIELSPSAASAPASVPAASPSASPDASPYALDVVPLVSRQSLWDRVRAGFSITDLDSDLVRKWEQYYSGRPDYVGRMLERGSRYLYHIVEEVEKRGMPSELALLPFIESAFNPLAQSSARASGMWQFMPATGREFSLRQNIFRDDRRSVLESTRAALDYLQMLHRMFGDWQLALAAYNWGQGNVLRAIANNRKRGLGTSYSELSMPDETRNYVPKLQAINNIVLEPQRYGLALQAVENHPFFLTVDVDRDIDVALAARLAGMSLEDFQALNPQLNKPVVLAAGTPQLLLPYDNAQRYQIELARHRGPLASWTAWVAPRTLRPADAARSVGMSEGLLREINRIPPRMLVKAGSTLLVPRSAHTQRDVSGHVADTAVMALAPEQAPGRRRMVKAGPRGETVAAMARRLRVSPAQLAQWNGTSAGGSFKPGQSVVMMVPAAKGGGRAVAKAPAQGAKGAASARKPAGRATATAAKPAAKGARPARVAARR